MKKVLKSIYDFVPFKKEIFSLLKIVWSPNESIYKHLHFKGIFTVHLTKTKSFKVNHYGYQIENEIFWSGINDGWEKDSLKLWIQLCEQANTIVDIGANTGVYSLVAKTINPLAKIYAFEPVARVFTKLKENVDLNKFDITCIEKAASNFDGNATIYDTNEEHIYSVTVNKNMSTTETAVFETIIETVTLNSFVNQYNIDQIDLMKIDVETHESEVLEGFSEYLTKFKPTLLIEILTEEVGKKVQAMIAPLDYLYFNLNENGAVRRVDTITKSDYYNYLLCSPVIAEKLGLTM